MVRVSDLSNGAFLQSLSMCLRIFHHFQQKLMCLKIHQIHFRARQGLRRDLLSNPIRCTFRIFRHFQQELMCLEIHQLKMWQFDCQISIYDTKCESFFYFTSFYFKIITVKNDNSIIVCWECVKLGEAVQACASMMRFNESLSLHGEVQAKCGFLS